MGAGAFLSVDVDPVYGCFLWTGRLDRDGYPIEWRSGRPIRAHRQAWEQERGPIPHGFELEHACRRRRCVRVEHLELVTRRQNEQLKRWRNRAGREKCPAGHSLFESGRRTPEGGIVCLTCTGMRT